MVARGIFIFLRMHNAREMNYICRSPGGGERRDVVYDTCIFIHMQYHLLGVHHDDPLFIVLRAARSNSRCIPFEDLTVGVAL